VIIEGRGSTHGLMTDHAPRLTLGRVSATLHLRRFRIEPRLLDLVFAVVLTAFGGAQVLVGHLAVGGRLVPGLAVPVLGAAVALRRRFPATAGTAATVVQSLTIALHGDPQVVSNAIAYLLALYALAVWTPTPRFVAGLAVGVATLLVPSSHGGRVLWTLVTLVVVLIVRQVVRDRDRRAELAERHRDLAAREAVAEERARVARELHDVVAHSVSVMVIQAQAGPRLLGDPEGLRGVFGSIESSGKEALAELRRLLGILRMPDGRPELDPQPGLGSLDALVDGVRAAGLPVEVRVEGTPRDLPVGVDLSAYRIIQEALTNSLKHAGPAEAEVILRYGPSSLQLEVVDNGSAGEASIAGAGPGLVGMRERVALYGGELRTGTRNGHGYAVRAILPLGRGL
jgi:signal transduction histidine kinase